MGQVRHPQQGRPRLRRGVLRVHTRGQDRQPRGALLPRTHVRQGPGDRQGLSRGAVLVHQGIRHGFPERGLLPGQDASHGSWDPQGRLQGREALQVGGRPRCQGDLRARSAELHRQGQTPGSEGIGILDGEIGGCREPRSAVHPRTVLQGRRRGPQGHPESRRLAEGGGAQQAQGRPDPPGEHVPHRRRRGRGCSGI